jgi:ribosomal protein S3
MGIKVWIMKGEVYGREIFLHLLEWTNKQAGGKRWIPRGKPLIKVENQTLKRK